MNRLFAVLGVALFLTGSASFADTTIRSTSVQDGGASNSTTVMHQDTPAPVVVEPAAAPVVQKTKFKEERHGLFHKTKIKGETTTVSP